MSAPGTPKASQAAITAVQEALLAEGAGPGNSIHSWRCEHPDRYGPCDCVLEVARAVADAAAPHNAAQALRYAGSWFASWTQEAAGAIREHWRGQEFVDGQDAGYERAADWCDDNADRIEAGQ